MALERRDRQGETKIGDPGATVVAHQDVLGLEVAVDQPRLMSGREPSPGREQERQPALERLRFPHPRAQSRTLDILHDQVHTWVLAAFVEGPDVVDRDHVGVGELRERPGLDDQPSLGHPRVRAHSAQVHDFDRHLAIELGVIAPVDDAHPTDADARLDHEAADRDHRRPTKEHPRDRRGDPPAIEAVAAGAQLVHETVEAAVHRGEGEARIESVSGRPRR